MKIKRTEEFASLMAMVKEFERCANEIGDEFKEGCGIGICADLYELRKGGIVFSYYGYGSSRENGKQHRQVKVYHDYQNVRCADISSYKIEFYLDAVMMKSFYVFVKTTSNPASSIVSFLWDRIF